MSPRNISRPPITQSAEPVARIGRDQRLGLLHRAQNKTCSARRLAKHFEDMEKRGGVFMVITYWSTLRSSLELGDRKWRLNRNGDQNFIHHEVESTYLECFKGRNV